MTPPAAHKTLSSIKSVSRKRSEKARFQKLLEQSRDAVIAVNPKARVLYASPSCAEVIGYLPEELTKMDILSLIHPRDRKRAWKLFLDLVHHPSQERILLSRVRQKDGSWKWLEGKVANYLQDPDIKAMVSYVRDISRYVSQEEKLFWQSGSSLQQVQYLENVLNALDEGLLITDCSGKILFANEAQHRYTKLKPQNIIGKNILDFLELVDEHNVPVPRKRHPLTCVCSSGTHFGPTILHLKKHTQCFLLSATPVFCTKVFSGTAFLFMPAPENETDRVNAAFMSMASHQLRTPLSTIRWSAQALSDKNITDAEKTEFLKNISAEGKRMSALIETLINVSRMELGALKVKKVRVHLPHLLAQVMEDYFPREAAEKSIILDQQFGTDATCLYTDPQLLAIILQNLLSNALKYTAEKGKIKISVIREKNALLFSIDDTGCGIPKNQQAHIFEKLFRADNAKKISPEGTGLGLYICKALTGLLGGEIWFTSEKNKGATFFLRLPCLSKTGK